MSANPQNMIQPIKNTPSQRVSRSGAVAYFAVMERPPCLPQDAKIERFVDRLFRFSSSRIIMKVRGGVPHFISIYPVFLDKDAQLSEDTQDDIDHKNKEANNVSHLTDKESFIDVFKRNTSYLWVVLFVSVASILGYGITSDHGGDISPK